MPESYTGNSGQKEAILKQIFDVCIVDVIENLIYADAEKYASYIDERKGQPVVYKYKVVEFINNEIGEDIARDTTITCKGLLDLVIKFPIIKEYIEKRIKANQ